MTALAVIPERITTMILLLLCGCSVVVTTTMAFQPTSMGSVLLSAAALSSPNQYHTRLLDAPVTDPVPVVPAEAVTATAVPAARSQEDRLLRGAATCRCQLSARASGSVSCIGGDSTRRHGRGRRARGPHDRPGVDPPLPPCRGHRA